MPPLKVKDNLSKTPYERFVEKWSSCKDCPLGCQRTRIVLARGSVPCDVLFVGEAPGKSEDVLGKPFCGPAGRLLDQIVEAVWKSQDQPDGMGGQFVAQTAFTNLVCCFPRDAKKTDNHQPTKSEIKACAPRLREFVELCTPKLIVAVGKLAKGHLHLAVDEASEEFEIVSILHPSAILQEKTEQVKKSMVKKCVVTLSNAVERMKDRL